MTRRWFLALALTVMATDPSLAATINVFLLGGQSNMDGRALVTELPSDLLNQTDVLFYSNNTGGQITTLKPLTSGATQFGPEIAFGRSMADYYAGTGEQVALIKYAAGGTNLQVNWKADGTSSSAGDGSYYQAFQNTVASGLAKLVAGGDTVVIRGMIWMQGESDAGDSVNGGSTENYSLLYEQNLTDFINDVRLTLGLEELPFVIGKLGTVQVGTGNVLYRDNVRAAQEAVAVADPFTGIVYTDTFAIKTGDNQHFGSDGINDGQLQLGAAFATEMQGLLAIPEPSAWLFSISGLVALVLLNYRRLSAA
jgi:iduronate 2-sulfatase